MGTPPRLVLGVPYSPLLYIEDLLLESKALCPLPFLVDLFPTVPQFLSSVQVDLGAESSEMNKVVLSTLTWWADTAQSYCNSGQDAMGARATLGGLYESVAFVNTPVGHVPQLLPACSLLTVTITSLSFKGIVYVPIQKHLCPLPSASSSHRDTEGLIVSQDSLPRESEPYLRMDQ